MGAPAPSVAVKAIFGQDAEFEISEFARSRRRPGNSYSFMGISRESGESGLELLADSDQQVTSRCHTFGAWAPFFPPKRHLELPSDAAILVNARDEVFFFISEEIAFAWSRRGSRNCP